MALKTNANDTHWVLVLSGNGTDPANYVIHDPWFEGGANDRLDARARTYNFVSLVTYEGQPNHSAVTSASIEQIDAVPVDLQSPLPDDDRGPLLGVPEPPAMVQRSDTFSATAAIYTMTAVTMTVKLEAESTAGVVDEMRLWTDTISNTTWQPFEPYAWLPVSDIVYVELRDTGGQVSSVLSDHANPSGPPTAPDPIHVFLAALFRH
jgi:hypothetical protein